MTTPNGTLKGCWNVSNETFFISCLSNGLNIKSYVCIENYFLKILSLRKFFHALKREGREKRCLACLRFGKKKAKILIDPTIFGFLQDTTRDPKCFRKFFFFTTFPPSFWLLFKAFFFSSHSVGRLAHIHSLSPSYLLLPKNLYDDVINESWHRCWLF